jgi:hypothetical protein
MQTRREVDRFWPKRSGSDGFWTIKAPPALQRGSQGDLMRGLLVATEVDVVGYVHVIDTNKCTLVTLMGFEALSTLYRPHWRVGLQGVVGHGFGRTVLKRGKKDVILQLVHTCLRLGHPCVSWSLRGRV